MTEATALLRGIAASHGVVVGPAVVLGRSTVTFPRRRVGEDQFDEELERFRGAVAAVQADLRATLAKLPQGRAEASILDAYVLMVADETLAEEVHREIYDRGHCADWAVYAAADRIAKRLAAVADAYLRERSHDIEFVAERLLRALGGDGAQKTLGAHLGMSEPSIVVARDLSPADTASMLHEPVLAFVTEVGSRTSHTSIMARALEIPAVVGAQGALDAIGTGDMVIVDGLNGRVVVHPGPEELAEAKRRAARFQALTDELDTHRAELAMTADGTRVALGANIELPDEAQLALAHGAEGVGLYRTEYLYVNCHEPPSEDAQLASFRQVIEAMPGANVTLRTFDIGGDKFVSAFRVPDQLNPMLGLRAVRLALAEPAMFLTQLRAMWRASAHGSIRIMAPLVATLDELTQVRALVAQARREVIEAGHSAADAVPLGVMIEVPSAAILADHFAREADFMSIGTNDLVQYALAVDRTNRSMADLASPFDPAILRLIEGVIAAGKRHDCPVSVCGEMASEPYGALLLAGLGVRSLSMESVAIPEIKEAMHRVALEELEELARTALGCRSAAEAIALLEKALEPRLHDLLTGQGREPTADAPAVDG